MNLEENFPLSIELPPFPEFRSGRSPLRLLAEWARLKTGDPLLHPNDYALGWKDGGALRREVRTWLQTSKGLRGKDLRFALNFHDSDRGPVDGKGLEDGFLHLKLPEKRWRAP